MDCVRDFLHGKPQPASGRFRGYGDRRIVVRYDSISRPAITARLEEAAQLSAVARSRGNGAEARVGARSF